MGLIEKVKQAVHHNSSSSSKTKHATAKVNGTVVADADHYEVVEGNIYVCTPELRTVQG